MKSERKMDKQSITVIGAGYTGLTTAAELTLRGFQVHVIADSLGYRPPLTICGTQSRRWPGSAISNKTFDNDDLLDKELVTITRFMALSTRPLETGVSIIPALKVSMHEGNTWNRRPLDEKRLREASEVQRCMRMAATPARVAEEDIKRFLAAGYATVDETQVVKIETERYFRYLMTIVTDAGGSVTLGTKLSNKDVEDLKSKGHVVNCMGGNAGKVGGSGGTYYSNPGEVVIWARCPRQFPFYIMDDDKDAGVMTTPDGRLYLSTSAKDGKDQTRNTVSDCDRVCEALFGEKLSLHSGDGFESWKTDRPMRKEGFNIGAKKSGDNVAVENSGHGGAGVAASWACAALATESLLETIGGHKW